MTPTTHLRQAALLLVLLAIAGSAYYWWRLTEGEQRLRQATVAQANSRAAQLAEAEADHVEAWMAAIDLTLKQFRDAVARGEQATAIKVARSALAEFPPGALLHFAVIDARGKISYSTEEATQTFDVGDRDYFKFHRAGGSDRLFIDKPMVARRNDQWLVLLTRPIFRGQRFAGVALLSLSPEYLAARIGDVGMATDDVITLFYADGSYLARSHNVLEVLGKKLPPDRPFLGADGPRAGHFRAVSNSDGVVRLYAWARLDGLPLAINVGLDERAILAPVEREVAVGRQRSLIGIALLLGLVAVIAALLTRVARQQEGLARSEVMLRSTLDSTADGILVVAAAGNIVQKNRQFDRLWQLPEEPADSGDDARLLAHLLGQLAQPEQFLRGVEQANKSDKDHWDQLLFKDGRVFERYSRAFSDGAATFRLWSFRDISARRRAESRVENQHAQLRALITTIPDLVWLKDPDGVFMICNPAFEDLFGRKEEEIVGKTDYDFVPRELADHFRANDKKAVANGHSVVNEEWLTFCGSGYRGLFETTKTPMYGPDGELIGVLGVAHDITQRRRLEETLREQEIKYRTLFETASDGIFLYDRSGCIDCNARGAAMYGLPRDRLLGLTPYKLAPPQQADGRSSAELVAEKTGLAMQGMAQVFEWQALRGDGQAFDLEVTLSKVQMGGPTYLQAICRDITERKKVDAAVRQALSEAKRLAQVRSDFLANMSHEIRTPLNSVLGLAQVGFRDSQGRKAAATFKRILDSGQLLLAVVNDILDVTKIEAGKMDLEVQRFSLGEVIDRTVSIVSPRAFAKGLEFQLEEADDLPETLIGDPTRLSQVLVNLLANAVKFTESGRVALSVRREPGGIAFAIADTGIGMNASQLAQIFEPFVQADSSVTRRFGGTGLGLSISRRLVELMHGEIKVESRAGQGSLFTVHLPQPAAAAASAAAPALSVRLLGLAASEAQRLAGALAARGGSASIAPAGAEFTASDAALTVIDCKEYERLKERLDGQQQRIAIVCTPGHECEIRSAAEEAHPLLERPLRLRQLLAAGNAAMRVDVHGAGCGPRLAGLRLLAAEDNPANQLVLEEMLGQEGASLTCVENGIQLCDLVSAAGAHAFDLVITDIQMPLLDGYEATRRLHAIAPELPVIGLTAHAMPQDKDRCLAAGMVDRLTKPVDLDALVAAILRQFPQRTPPVAAAPPGATRARDQGLVDWDGLASRYQGKPGFVARLARTVLASLVERLPQLHQALANGDLPALASHAHWLKGSGSTLMAQQLCQLAAQVEETARQNRREAQAMAQDLAQTAERLAAELELRVRAARNDRAGGETR